MIEKNDGTIRAVAWLEVFPWLRLVRAFRMAISARALVLGALGILLTAMGWALIGGTFHTDSDATKSLRRYATCPWLAVTDDVVPDHPGDDSRPRIPGSSSDFVEPFQNPIFVAWATLSTPAFQGLSADSGFERTPLQAVIAILLSGLWAAAVWAFFGAAICRTAAVRLAADEQIGWGSAIRFAIRKWPAHFAAPLLPVGGVLLMAIPIVVLGWIMCVPGIGPILGGLLWFLVLAVAFVMAVLLLGLLFGWPLMWGAISAEGTDSFDALSRSYAYTFQKPLHYLFYAAVAGFLGWLGWLLVLNFAAGVVWLGYWAAGWGLGSENVRAIMSHDKSVVSGVGVALIHFWAGCVKLLAVGYLFSYFWTASTAIYFLLRRDVDATELDEVFLDADATEPAIETQPVVEPLAAEPPKPAEQAGGGEI